MNDLTKMSKRALFFFLESLRNEPIKSALIELRYNQRKGAAYLQDLQQKKLQFIISHCYNNTIFYNKLYERSGVFPDSIRNVDDLKKLPTVTKEEIRKQVKSVLSKSGPKIYPVKTSGSTGSPLKFYKDRIASAYSYAAMYRGLQWHGVDICDKEAYLWGIPIKRIDRFTSKLSDFTLNRFREKAFNLSFEVNMDFYKKMVKRQPVLLSGYSSLLYEFALFIKKQDLPVDSIRPKVIKYTAEMMYEFQRELIESVFGCPVIGEYGSAEIGVAAFQCEHKKYHVVTDCCILEFEKIENSKFYEIIATNLNGLGFPIIRYRTGDLVESPSFTSCSCGLPFPILENIIGRCADILVTPEGQRLHCNIFSYIIKYLIGKGFPIEKLIFVQDTTSQLKVLLAPTMIDNEMLKKEISHLIADRISPGIHVSFDLLSNDEQIRSGKLRYFISNINNKIQ